MSRRSACALEVALLCLLGACDNTTRRHESTATASAPPASRDAGGSGTSDSDPDEVTVDAALPSAPIDASDPASPRATSDAGPVLNDAGTGACWQLPAIDRVRLHPPSGNASALLQGKIEGSNTSPTNDFVELARVTNRPMEGEWVELRIAKPVPYRYVKYYGPPGSYGVIAELELYAGDVRMSGAGFGSAGAGPTPDKVFARALDGDTKTVFEGSVPDDNHVGLDLGAGHVLPSPSFTPGAGSYRSAVSVSISAEPDAQIFYTTDGSDPRTSGVPYTQPVSIDVGGTLLRAVATRPCALPSEVAQGLYEVGATVKAVQSSMHIGNSLTDTIVEYLQALARSGGVVLDFNRYTVPGAGTWLYVQTPSGGFGVPNVQEALRTRRFDHLSLQPFPNMPCQITASADGSDSDSGFIQQAWKDARTQNPNVQLWIYQQWPAPKEFRNCISGGAWTRGSWRPSTPASWEEAVKNELSYQEGVRAELVRLNPDAPPPYIVPAGNALVALKKAIEAGSVPGMNEFFSQIFAAQGTDLHLTRPGAYFVTLVFYACMFQKSPAGTSTDPSWGVSAELAAKLQQIAWDSVTSYALSGASR